MFKQVLIAGLMLGLLFFGGWQFRRATLATADLERLQADGFRRDTVERLLRWQITLLKDSDTEQVGLTDGQDKVVTRVYYNPQRQEAALDLGGVQAPPQGQFLQLWAEVGNERRRLGMVPRTAVGSWHPFLYVGGARGFFISQDKAPDGDDFPSIVLMRGFLRDSL